MTEERSNTQDKKMIQLNQKLLHYRSEVVKQDRILADQHKRLLDQDEVIHELTARIEELANNPAIAVQEEVAEPIQSEANHEAEEANQPTIQIDSYFTYAIMAPFETKDDEPFVIKGHMVIENRSSTSFINPVICLSFNKPALANLSGRIERSKTNLNQYSVSRDGVTDTWKFVEEKDDKQAKETGQFWLTPPIDEIPAQSTITFSDFEIIIPTQAQDTSLSLQVSGYVYGAELPEGKASLNTITLTVS
ncbi:hypothetical protein ABC345_12945 [Shouchella sp. 1P09AA]|uniref:hypothetical protein n=1 Tax=unclassified Shouchella TaxID=2893065 RepID=UPI0039A3300E